ncbi:MAG: lanthionine synthetase LanC family protein [Bacteroidaceae bacterium]|jgi:hypothetical protein
MKNESLSILEKIIENHPLRFNNPGLLTGGLGTALTLFCIHKNFNNPRLQNHANLLIDQVYGQMSQKDITFASGLTGISFGIEHLANKGFINRDATYNILSSIDDTFFNFIAGAKELPLNFTNGLSGFLIYLAYRIKNRDIDKKQSIILKESLRIVINKIWDESANALSFIGKDVALDLFDPFSSTLYALARSFNLNIYNEKIESILRVWLYALDVSYPRISIHRLLLANSLTVLSNSIRKNKESLSVYYSSRSLHWYNLEKTMENTINRLLSSIDYEEFNEEFSSNNLRLENGWHSITLLLWLSEQNFSKNRKIKTRLNSERMKILKIHLHSFKEYLKKQTLLKTPLSLNISNGIIGVFFMMSIFPRAFELENKKCGLSSYF